MRATDHGFTMMETIVALIVFTGVFIALERGTAFGWRGIRTARMDQAALALARAKLSVVGVETPITEESDDDGTENGLTWRVAIRGYKPPDVTQLDVKPRAYWVTVAVNWRDRPVGPLHSVELTTLKPGAAP